ncbi:MAG: PAS domain-containing protein, partial [Betaproteobacteria bacterium]|nr:PAS domain-containing protein [Betaproteobacteria bacterium]
AIGRELVKISRHPYVAQPFEGGRKDDRLFDNDQLETIFGLIRAAKGVDFTYYKHSTIKRRILRRMMLNRIDRFPHYVDHLKRDPAEIAALYNDILINVTEFFRDRGVFEALKSEVFPQLLRQRSAGSQLRIWVPGCAGGEEAYSIAMCLHEYFGNTAASVPVQIFATDVSDAAVDKARAGIYPENGMKGVSAERQQRFFVKTDGGYQVARQIRDMCVFARQDLTKDPPFSQLDLISCRNVLIYLGNALQKRIIPAFHYALKPHGFLLLGTSESIGGFSDLFMAIDKEHKIYGRKPGVSRPHLEIRHHDERSQVDPHQGAALASGDPAGIEHEADRLLLTRYSPPGVLISEEMNILQFRGQTGTFLDPAPGAASLNLLKLARPELQMTLRKAVTEAARNVTPVKVRDVRLRTDGFRRKVHLEVIPVATVPAAQGRYFLVLFEEDRSPAAQPPHGRAAVGKRGAKGEDQEFVKLQDELAATREYLQSVIEEQEAANEELRSANEESHSTNEELQSINEELETAKEELQSTNEELNTMNEELHTVNQELTQVNTDLRNLLDGVDIAIVMLGGDLRIRRFTPTAAALLNLIDTDVGRSIGDLKPNLDVPNLDQMIQGVINTLHAAHRPVRDRAGRQYDLRIKPYRTADNRVDGAVMTIVQRAVEATA